MDIYVQKDGQKFGPYSETKIRENLDTGEFAPTDLAWRDGLDHWQSLSVMLLPSRMPPIPASICFIPNDQTFPKRMRQISVGAFIACGIALLCAVGHQSLLWLVFATTAIIAGHYVCWRTRAALDQKLARFLAQAGLITGYFSIQLVVLISLFTHHFSSTTNKEEVTKEFWDEIQEVETSANQQLGDMRLEEYPKVASGFFDFQHFNDNNFETLRAFYEKRANIQLHVPNALSSLSKLNVDGDLLSFTNELCKQWESGGKYDYEFAKIVSTAYEQRTQFTSGKAYAARMLNALSGDSRMEERYKESQSIIDNMAREWVAQRQVFQSNTDSVRVQEREIKVLLTQRYGVEFK